MKLELGKEYLNRSGHTCVVLDLNYNNSVLVKHLPDGYKDMLLTHNTDGIANSYQHPYDIIKEKPKELTLVKYVALYTTNAYPDELRMWESFSAEEKSEQKIMLVKSEILSKGHNFYGVQKIEFKSDGTKEKVNF